MPMGPGKYDKECEAALQATRGDCVLLIVLGGNRGSGFSMSATIHGFGVDVPKILRETADQIEQSYGRA